MNGRQQAITGVKFSRKAATFVIQAITGEGLAQGTYVAARGGVEPTIFRTEGTDNLHLTNHAPIIILLVLRLPAPWNVRTLSHEINLILFQQ